ncbi:glycosyltransferase family 2 protein [Pseudomonas sp. CFBP 13719]|nr:glycosyltransferase family 2 protein [Pseudomonas sp. CFBP 13719]
MNVITLVHGRERQLDNVIRGLEQGSLMPEAFWVVFMNQPARELRSDCFPIHCLVVDDASHGLPLARARNAVRQCEGEQWVFLDVDCIPSQSLLSDYTAALRERPEALHLGEVRYLPSSARMAHWTQATLMRDGVAHPLSQYRGKPGSLLAHHLFWSLNFACTREVFERIGGFDEGYLGYGAEDTDFAFSARHHGVELRTAAALAFHQYHPTWRPPLNHFSAIVANAQRFYQRWAQWPMEGWLGEFAELGLVSWTPDSLEILRHPTDAEVDACLDQAGSGF